MGGLPHTLHNPLSWHVNSLRLGAFIWVDAVICFGGIVCGTATWVGLVDPPAMGSTPTSPF